MTDFQLGTIAPDFSLQEFTLSQELKKGPILLTFYKKTCPTCQLAYPLLERLHKLYTSENFQVIGIGQDPETKEFATQYKITFPLISDTSDYKVSKQYHLTHVPSIFLIDPDQKIQFVTVGFSKKDFILMSQEIAKKTKQTLKDLFTPQDFFPEFKPG